MTKEELIEILEPITIEFKEQGRVAAIKIVDISQRWIEEGDHSGLSEAFTIWNDIVWNLAQKHRLTKRRLN